jgi:hypothetical protein
VSPSSEFILINYSRIASVFEDNVAVLCVGSTFRKKPQFLPPEAQLEITVHSHILLVGSNTVSPFYLRSRISAASVPLFMLFMFFARSS